MTRRRWLMVVGVVLAAVVIGALVRDGGTDRDGGDTAMTRDASTTTTERTTTTDATTSTSPPPTTETTVSSTLPPDETVESPGGSRVATDLHGRSYCDEQQPSRGLADLSWSPAVHRGTEQRVQVTRFADGFESGNYELGPVLGPDVSSFRYEDPQGTAKHMWRVLTRRGDTWAASDSAEFFGPGCIGDDA